MTQNRQRKNNCSKSISEHRIHRNRGRHCQWCDPCHKGRLNDQVITLAIKRSFTELGRKGIRQCTFGSAIFVRSYQVVQSDLWRNTIRKQHQENGCQYMPYGNRFCQDEFCYVVANVGAFGSPPNSPGNFEIFLQVYRTLSMARTCWVARFWSLA